MTPSDKSYSEPQNVDLNDLRLKRGTRRQHLNSGEVWRVVALDSAGLWIDRERDGERRCVSLDYWLGDGWARPKSRAAIR